MSQTHYRACPLCEALCGIEIRLEGHEIASIRGDAADPFSRGHICPKAVALKDLHEDPDRLRRPVEKVDGQWRELGWEEALDKAAAGLRAVQSARGDDAVGVYLGNPNAHNTGAILFGPMLWRALKTRNKFSATSVDQLPHHLACWKLFGHQLRIPVPDIDRTDFFLMLGANPLASNGSIMTVPDVRNRLKAVQQRGRVVVIDPRRTETAQLADSHHFIRPGSDVLLLLAMLHLLYAEDRIQPGAVAPLLDTEPEALRARFAPYTPERVAPLIGIDAVAIRQLVTDFCAAEAPVLYGRMGVSVQHFGALCQYLILLFNILSGRLDTPGGLMFPQPAADHIARAGRGSFDRVRSRGRGLPGFGGELPVSTLAEGILTGGDGQIRAMILAAGNPMVSTPNGEQLDRALGGLEFMVAIDYYINESNRHADIILPPVGPLEREQYDLIFHGLAVRNTTRYSPALFTPPADARHDWQIMLDLKARLRPPRRLKEKVGHRLLRKLGPRPLIAVLLRKSRYPGLRLRKLARQVHGVDLGPLQPALPEALFHADGRIHLATDFYLPDLIRMENHFFGPEANRSDFVLIGRRHLRSNNSWMHNSHRLVKGKSRCTAMLHPDDAARIGLNGSGRVRVSSRVGQVEIEAEVNADIMPGVVSIPHGWGHHRAGTGWRTAEAHAGVSVNDLTDERDVDRLSGNAVLNGVPVRVEAVHEA